MPLRIGVSACLTGERVRWDGGHKKNAFVTAVLAPHVEWVAVCPEMELGLGVPRPPMNIVDGRLIVEPTGEDLTERMRAYAAWRAKGLSSLDLDGYVLKSRSPSCAREHGLFACALAVAMPCLPMEEEARLARASIRDHFIERVLAAARWRELAKRPRRAGDLVAFHSAHKYLLLAHSPEHCEQLGTLVATAGRRRIDDVVRDYGALFAAAMAVRATPGQHVNALEHMAGFFKRQLSEAERLALRGAIEDFRRGDAPLSSPLALTEALARRHGVTYLSEQVYLQPAALKLLS
jgi:uncharacterized protein YbgA (DUF1722 family)/uncharacterized protein YbbK (DUF523 family)